MKPRLFESLMQRDGEFKEHLETLRHKANVHPFLRELVEVDEELWSDVECAGRAEALLANQKDPAESLAVRSTVLDYGGSPILAGDKVHIVLPNEGVDADFRVLSAEYNVDAGTQTLETVLELGREAPMLADYVYALRSKTDSLSRYKVARA
jgi:hypothetical protein